MIDYLQSVTAAQAMPGSSATGAGAAGGNFGQWLTQQIESLNGEINAADMEVRRLALGSAGNIHDVMTRLETAKLSFELAVQVRNRILEAYQDILRMQI
ncbi:MAG TPA: flagellar hook-basal body complex protein FliE [Burkholderiales bacterium]